MRSVRYPISRVYEGAPYQLVCVPGAAAHLARFSDVATDTPPEEKSLRDSVGAVEGGDADGKDDVEGGGGAKVDDTDENCYHSENEDGVIGDCCFGVHLVGKKLEFCV